jgi:hypothetical protein
MTSAAVPPPRRSWLRRARARVQCIYMRALIRWAESDVRHLQESLEQLPLHIELMSNHVAGLQVELMLLEQEL